MKKGSEMALRKESQEAELGRRGMDLLSYTGDTLPETNIAPENRVSQKETSIPTIHFQVLC